MTIQFSGSTVFIPDLVLIVLASIIPALIFSRLGQKKGILKFLMSWSFFNFVWLLAYMLFSHDPFASFVVFHVLAFGLLSLIFY